MSSSSCERYLRATWGAILAAAFVAGTWSTRAAAQTQPQGFALERFYPSAPGAGWMVMDDLRLAGGLGGALELSSGYAHNPLRIASSDGGQHLSLVKHQAFFAFGAAVTYDRFRLYTSMSSPLIVRGDSGSIDGYSFAPGKDEHIQRDCGQARVCVDPGWNPDTLSDARIGFDARILGEPKGAFRLGLSTQLFIPAGHRVDYMTDDAFRSMDRVLFAGDLGGFTYAGHLGVHFRRLNESAPGSPRGSEMLFGLAGGPRLSIGRAANMAPIVGPELWGVTPFRSFFGSRTTGLEALLSGRLEGTGEHGRQLRLKVGAGAGLLSEFGAPDYRFVLSVEMFGRVE